MTVTKTGYVNGSASGVAVTAGATTTQNFALTAAPTTGTLTGKISVSGGGTAIARRDCCHQRRRKHHQRRERQLHVLQRRRWHLRHDRHRFGLSEWQRLGRGRHRGLHNHPELRPDGNADDECSGTADGFGSHESADVFPWHLLQRWRCSGHVDHTCRQRQPDHGLPDLPKHDADGRDLGQPVRDRDQRQLHRYEPGDEVLLRRRRRERCRARAEFERRFRSTRLSRTQKQTCRPAQAGRPFVMRPGCAESGGRAAEGA